MPAICVSCTRAPASGSRAVRPKSNWCVVSWELFEFYIDDLIGERVKGNSPFMSAPEGKSPFPVGLVANPLHLKL